ncbi:hypothetical protein VM1G_06397 [Cytospora mali]|uniref:Uncharacterized protein n=1 Tax=Cytospora mali TaxID=578113 RepID=A0A194W333_CYTMA|nr:hypothetical protein VM1G_06397 [Valsa mali]
MPCAENYATLSKLLSTTVVTSLHYADRLCSLQEFIRALNYYFSNASMAFQQPPRPAKYWPGGIPTHIRCHPEPLKMNVKEELKSWFLFIKESYVPPDPGNQDPDYELNQRRRLVSQWASMSQEDRNAYHDRAPLPADLKPPPAYKMEEVIKDQMPNADCNCVAPLRDNPRNRALWTKMRILTYHLQGDDGPMFDSTSIAPNPDSGDESFLKYSSVETANFWGMAMTRQGTVIFTQLYGAVMFVDQEALDTGRLLMCDFANNGEITESARIRISHMPQLYLMAQQGGDVYGRDILRHSIANAPMDLEPPILDVLEDLKDSYHQNFHGGIDEWMDDIERYAPGYLDMEEASNGMVPDYDHVDFRNEEELLNIPRADIEQ